MTGTGLLSAAAALMLAERAGLPPEARGVIRNCLPKVNRLKIRKKTVAKHGHQHADEKIALDLERLGGNLPFAPSDILADEVGARSQPRESDARATPLEGWITALNVGVVPVGVAIVVLAFALRRPRRALPVKSAGGGRS